VGGQKRWENAMSVAVSINIAPSASEPVQWAAAHLKTMLLEAGHAGHVSVAAVPEHPAEQDGFTIAQTEAGLLITPLTERGAVYALTELAERVRCAGPEDRPLHIDSPIVEQAVSKVRSLNRFFSSEAEDKPWFYDEQMWLDYFTMLVTHRYTRFSLAFGLGYNYPYYNKLITDVYFYFAYPFLVAPDGYDVQVDGLSDSERQRNLDMLRFIAREAAKRGLEFQLALWTHGYDFDDVPNANYQIRGITKDNHAAYCRDALRELVQSVPDITGLTVRVHVEGGVPEGSYAFWETVLSGVRGLDRPLSLDIHAKGTDQRMIDIGINTGLPVSVSPKFMAEHSGLPYHQASVRRREMPSDEQVGQIFALSEGSRRFLRYGYGDLFAQPRNYDVLIRLWPGTQRVLLSADPALAAGYGRSAAFCGASGIEFFEPMSMKGRMGSGRVGQRFAYEPEALRGRYDWSKYEYGLLLLGRLAFNPNASPESWQRWLRHEAGSAAPGCHDALAAAARILPIVTQIHGVSACNNTYWPEIYDNMSIVYAPPEYPYGYDSDGASRFGTVPTFDPQLFANPYETIQSLATGTPLLKYTALDAARWLEDCAEASEAGIRAAEASADAQRPAVRGFIADARIQAGLGRFFAARLRSACAFEIYLLAGGRAAYDRTRTLYQQARAAWVGIIRAAEGVYQTDLSYGVQPWLRGAWRDRLPAIDRDIDDLDYWYINDRNRPVAADHAAQMLSAMDARVPPADVAAPARQSEHFAVGRPLTVRVFTADCTTARLFWRRVNQAFGWSSAEMSRAGTDFVADIPATETQGDFPLQYYVVFDSGQRFLPGLGASLCEQPYVTLLPAA
jgi:hypothetical protein